MQFSEKCVYVDIIKIRMEKVVLKSNSSQAKVMGTIISISGAFVVTFYKGPRIIFSSSPTISLSLHHNSQQLSSSDSNWVIGSLLLTAEYILVPLWYIVQVIKSHFLIPIIHSNLLLFLFFSF